MTKVSQTEVVHGTCVAINGSGVMLTGVSGSGKSDLALRLIDRGAVLISDDYVELSRQDDAIMLDSPREIEGKIEIRSLGVFEVEHISGIPLTLQVRLNSSVERFPMDKQSASVLGVVITTVALNANEASTPIKVEMALRKILETRKKT